MKRPIAILLYAAITAMAGDAEDMWKLTYTTSNGLVRESNLNLTVEGDTLAGTLSSDRGTARIEHGSLRGNEIAFDLIRSSNNDQITVHFKGRIEGDTMKLTLQFGTRDPIPVLGRKGS